MSFIDKIKSAVKSVKKLLGKIFKNKKKQPPIEQSQSPIVPTQNVPSKQIMYKGGKKVTIKIGPDKESETIHDKYGVKKKKITTYADGRNTITKYDERGVKMSEIDTSVDGLTSSISKFDKFGVIKSNTVNTLNTTLDGLTETSFKTRYDEKGKQISTESNNTDHPKI